MSTSRPLREALCAGGNLSAAYARYRHYRGLWAPGVPMWKVAEAPVEPMLHLAEELREGRYRPHPPQSFSIAKANGERRELKVYALRDRVAQRALLQAVQPRTEPQMAPFSHGYRPGRGVAGAAAEVRHLLANGLTWVVDADIEHCFDAIPRTPLLEQVARRLDDAEAPDWVARMLGWAGSAARDVSGIPQGAVLSPWLCNIYLWQLDDAMSARGAAMVRFADDFVLAAPTRSWAERLEAACQEALKHLGLRLHPAKTAIVHADRPFRFLGEWFRVNLALPPVAMST